MKSKSGMIWRVAVAMALVLAFVPVLVASPVLAAAGHTVDLTNTTPEECMPGESVGIEVLVNNTSGNDIVQVKIDIPPEGPGASTWDVDMDYWVDVPDGWSVSPVLDELGKIDTLTYSTTTDPIVAVGSETFKFTATAPSEVFGGYVFTVTTDDGVDDLVVSTFTIDVLPVTATLAGALAEAEETLDGSTITVTLARDTYDGVGGVDPANFDLDAPTGVTVVDPVALSVADTVATLTLAYVGDIEVDDTLTVTVAKAALVISTEDVVSNTLDVAAFLNDTEVILEVVVGDLLTEETLDESEITVTLVGDTYADAIGAASFDLITAPAVALTVAADADVVRTSDTVATLTLTFAEGADFEEPATLQVTVDDLALTYCTADVNSNTVDITANVDDATVTLTVVGEDLTAENLDKSEITATVTGDTYDVGEIAEDSFDLTAAPEGTEIASVVWVDATEATLTMAFDGPDFDVALLTVTVAADALVFCTVDVVSDLAIGPPPEATFTVSQTVALVGEDVVFTSTSKFIDSWKWDFDGDDTVDSTDETDTHAYAEKGVYAITLTVTNIIDTVVSVDTVEIIVVPAIAGDKGDTGDAGDKGDTGDAGAKGDTGDAGAPGAPGDTGTAGTAGTKGDTGTDGTDGTTGATGAPGAQGEAGAGASKALPIVALVLAIAALLGVGITILRKGS